MAEVPRPEHLTNTVWRDDTFFQQFPLNLDTVLDYFSRSPFYVIECNNEECKRRGLPTSALRCGAWVLGLVLEADSDQPCTCTLCGLTGLQDTKRCLIVSIIFPWVLCEGWVVHNQNMPFCGCGVAGRPEERQLLQWTFTYMRLVCSKEA
jgi:hypothetical protein